MIGAATFTGAARELGFTLWSGVPCSFLTPLINQVLDDGALSWVGAVNEGDAVATAAGAFLGGRRGVVLMQNSGLGNAVNPITSLLQTFAIPVLLLVTWRGDPAVRDEPQHRLMGRITPDLLAAMEIACEPFPTADADVLPALRRADEHLCRTSRPFAFLVRKGSVAGPGREPRALRGVRAATPAALVAPPLLAASAPLPPSRRDVLQQVVASTPADRSIVVATTGYTGRELSSIADRPHHLYMVGSMGCASALGLGLSLARPDRHVVVLDGDGALLMRMGNLATAGAYAGANFTHVLLDNGVHDSTGGQGTVAPHVSFAGVAAACGYAAVVEAPTAAWLGRFLATRDGAAASGDAAASGAAFVHCRIQPGAPADLPRPELSPEAVRARLMRHLGSEGEA